MTKGKALGPVANPPTEFGGDVLVWAAWLYYEENRTQEEIAKIVGVSRATVVSLLQRARDSGVVSISVSPYHLGATTMAQEIARRFNIVDCLVVPDDGGETEPYLRVGKAAAKLLADRLLPGDVLGVSWGRTVLALSEHIPPLNLPTVSVVQITGSAIGTYRFSAELCASNIATRLRARCIQLHAPGIVSHPDVKRMLMQEPSLQEQFHVMSKCNRLVLGVGGVAESSTAFETGFISEQEARPYLEKGAVAVVAGRFLDAQGHAIGGEIDNRMIGMTIDEIKKIPERICVAAGKEKVEPIRAVLRGGLATTLVTDEQTAQLLLQ